MIRAADAVVAATQSMTLFLVGRDPDTKSMWVDRAPIVAWLIDQEGHDPPWPQAIGVSEEEHGWAVFFLELEDGRSYRTILDGQTFETEDEAVEHARQIFDQREKLKNPP